MHHISVVHVASLKILTFAAPGTIPSPWKSDRGARPKRMSHSLPGKRCSHHRCALSAAGIDSAVAASSSEPHSHITRRSFVPRLGRAPFWKQLFNNVHYHARRLTPRRRRPPSCAHLLTHESLPTFDRPPGFVYDVGMRSR
jgi:hypothetical protein